MPELPEVEIIVQGLKRIVKGERISQVAIYFPEVIRSDKNKFASRLRGCRFEDVRRRGKFIIIGLSGGKNLIIHLGMTGQLLYVSKDEPLEKHTHVVFKLSKGDGELRYNDLRRFGFMRLAATGKLKNLPELKLGPDALGISGKDFALLISKRRARIKPLLLDQRTISGLGNIYTDEALFRARIHPQTLGSSLNQTELKHLHNAIHHTLKSAIEHRGSSTRSYLQVDGRRGSYQILHRVYGREGEPCFRCHHRIARIKLGGRSTYYCPQCQR